MILYNASSSYFSMISRYALLESGVSYENRRLDIHIAKEQLSSWYRAINPQMTVPSLVDSQQSWLNSRDILNFAVLRAGAQWLDSDKDRVPPIQQIINRHYQLSIERLTFCKALESIVPLRPLMPKILRSTIKLLQKQLSEQSHPINKEAIEAKIALNTERLLFFTDGDLLEKLSHQRQSVVQFLEKLPNPQSFLFGEQISSADIVTVVLFARLQMIKEYDLVANPLLRGWFERMQKTPLYKKADIWTHFKFWRILMKK